MRLRHGLVATTLVAAIAATGGCAKKKKDGDPDESGQTTEDPGKSKAKSVDDALVTAATGTLLLPGALNLLVSDENAGLRLADDYAADSSHFYTDDRSMDALKTIQMIMCFMSKTGYATESLVNKGPYLAQVDFALCERDGEGGGDGGGGQQGGQQAKEVKMTPVVVDATREENKPLKAKIWMDMSHDDEGGGGGGKERIAINLTVAEGPSAANPVGIFRLVFKQSMVGKDGAVTPAGGGQLEAKRDEQNNVVVSFFEKGDRKMESNSESWNTAVAVRLGVADEKVVGGWANLKQDSTGTWDGQAHTESSDFKLAFDKLHFAAHDNVKGENLCKDQNAFNMSVWQYGVYDAATHERVKMKGGFGFTFDKEGGKGRGWASYYGIWMEDGDLADGAVITAENYGNASAPAATYTVKKGKGKLVKHVRHALTLDELDGIEMEAYDMDGSKRVVYSKAAGKFQVTGTRSNGGGGNGPSEYQDVNPPTDYTVSQYGASFYSQALGGRVELAMSEAGVATGAAFFTEEDVTGTAAAMTLHCLQGCSKGNLTAAMVQANQTQHQANENDPWAPFTYETAKSYTFDPAGLVLNGADGPIVVKDGETISEGMWIPGMEGLVDDTTFAAMQANGVQPYNARSQDVTYTWNVGVPGNSWSTYTALLDSAGKPVVFDSPIVINYTHKAENDVTGAATSPSFGKKFHIQFDGQSLQIPGHQDKDTGYWVNDFAIKGGVTSDDGKYVFKPLEGTKYMKTVDAGQCAGLDVNSVPALPDTTFDEAKANQDAPPATSGLTTMIVNGELAAQ